jgi:HK97 family phage major capsid protein
MKNSVELRQDRAALIADANVMLESCKTESRDFNETEQVSYDEKMTAIDKLAKSIETVERQEKLNAEIASNVGYASVQKTSDIKEVRDYSVFKAISGMMNNNLDGVEKEMHNQAVNEARAAGFSVNGLGIPSFMLEARADVTQGGSAIAPTNVLGYAEAMREASVFNNVGARILTGLTANTNIPVTGTSTVAWAAENGTAADGGAEFTKVELSPVRLAATVDISKQLLLQNGGAEAAIMADLGRAVAGKIDQAIFNDTTISGAPASISATSGVNTFTEAAFSDGVSVISDLVTAEQVLASANGLEGNLGYVCSPELLAQIKRGVQVAAVSAGLDGMLVNGYPIKFTNGCGKSAGASGDFVYGDFSKLIVGLFGGVDIMVDPYTQAANGQTRLVVNNYVDFGVTQGAGFVKGTSLVA